MFAVGSGRVASALELAEGCKFVPALRGLILSPRADG